MLRTLLVTLMIATTTAISAEEMPETISVSGSGTAPATPDRAAVHMSIVVRNMSLDAVQQQAADTTAKVLAITDKLKIKRSQVDTTGASVRPDYRYNRNSGDQEFKGYIAERQLNVEVRDLDKLAKLVEGAVAAGVNQVSPPNLYSSKRKESYRKALASAARDARANAQQLAEALDVKLGAPISVSSSPGGRPPMPQMRGGAMAMAVESDAAETYNAGDQTVTANVSIVFEIAE